MIWMFGVIKGTVGENSFTCTKLYWTHNIWNFHGSASRIWPSVLRWNFKRMWCLHLQGQSVEQEFLLDWLTLKIEVTIQKCLEQLTLWHGVTSQNTFIAVLAHCCNYWQEYRVNCLIYLGVVCCVCSVKPKWTQ